MKRYSYRRRVSLDKAKRHARALAAWLAVRLHPVRVHRDTRKLLRNARSVNGRSIPRFVRRNLIDKLSFKKIFLIWIAIIIIFGFIYAGLELVSPGNGLLGIEAESLHDSILDSIYFSFITATSTGFGDITPLGTSRLISVVEAVSGMIMFGIVLSKLVSFKQEVILNEIYEISFDEKVNRLRSGLYLPRSDMENLIHRFVEGKSTRGASDRMLSAINSASEALEEIQRITCMGQPKKKQFVKSLGGFQLELLLNSMKLTLTKLSDLISHMNEHSYNWRTERNVEAVKSMLSVADGICSYQKLTQRSESILKRVAGIEAAMSGIQKRL